MTVRVASLQTQRWGVKGPRAAAWLEEQQVTLPRTPNSWELLDNDPSSVILRLGTTQFFLDECMTGTRCETLAAELVEAVPGVYPMLREDASLQLEGPAAHLVLAEACSFDFGALPTATRQVVMTLVLGVAVCVIAQGDAGARCYRIWCAPTYGPGLCEVLRGIAADLR